MNVFAGLVNKLKEYRRVLKITKKPSMDEFKSISQVTAIGLAIIGLIGFVINMIGQYITLTLK